jgi:hypothetical protein
MAEFMVVSPSTYRARLPVAVTCDCMSTIACSDSVTVTPDAYWYMAHCINDDTVWLDLSPRIVAGHLPARRRTGAYCLPARDLVYVSMMIFPLGSL